MDFLYHYHRMDKNIPQSEISDNRHFIVSTVELLMNFFSRPTSQATRISCLPLAVKMWISQSDVLSNYKRSPAHITSLGDALSKMIASLLTDVRELVAEQWYDGTELATLLMKPVCMALYGGEYWIATIRSSWMSPWPSSEGYPRFSAHFIPKASSLTSATLYIVSAVGIPDADCERSRCISFRSHNSYLSSHHSCG